MAQDDTDCIEAVHRLAGAAASLGLTKLFNLCIEFETLLKSSTGTSSINRTQIISEMRTVGAERKNKLREFLER